MNFPFSVYLPAFFGAMLISFCSLPLWRKVTGKLGLWDDPGPRKIHETPMPLVGGFAVLTGMVVPLLAGIIWIHWQAPKLAAAGRLLEHGLERRWTELAAILAGAGGMVLLGGLDDKFELRPAVKFGGQLLIAFLVTAAGVRITLFVQSLAFSYAITVLWLLTVINAFNFMDNMNGLCAGLGAIGAWFFAIIAAMEGQYLVALTGLLACGALLGFLPHNFPRASAFLGDSGSHLVGYLLAVLAILPHFYNRWFPHRLAVLIPVLVLAVPLGDMVWVVLSRWRRRQPFYIGDNHHLSHRLVKLGHSPRRAVLEIWLLAVVLGAIAVLSVLV